MNPKKVKSLLYTRDFPAFFFSPRIFSSSAPRASSASGRSFLPRPSLNLPSIHEGGGGGGGGASVPLETPPQTRSRVGARRRPPPWPSSRTRRRSPRSSRWPVGAGTSSRPEGGSRGSRGCSAKKTSRPAPGSARRSPRAPRPPEPLPRAPAAAHRRRRPSPRARGPPRGSSCRCSRGRGGRADSLSKELPVLRDQPAASQPGARPPRFERGPSRGTTFPLAPPRPRGGAGSRTPLRSTPRYISSLRACRAPFSTQSASARSSSAGEPREQPVGLCGKLRTTRRSAEGRLSPSCCCCCCPCCCRRCPCCRRRCPCCRRRGLFFGLPSSTGSGGSRTSAGALSSAAARSSSTSKRGARGAGA